MSKQTFSVAYVLDGGRVWLGQKKPSEFKGRGSN